MAPVVENLEPVGGSALGNNPVTLIGSDLAPTTEVTFGGIEVPLFRVESDTRITVVAPSLPLGWPQGAYPVVVSGPDGTSRPDAPGVRALYTYERTVTPVDPQPVPLDVGIPLTPVENVRLLVGERIGPSQTEDDTRFSDDEVASAINRHNGNLYLAAGELWSSKAAIFSGLVDISESGSERKLSQLFRQANQMAASYTKAGEDFILGMISRPVGKSARILDPSLGSTFDAAGVPGDLYASVNPFASATARFWPILTVLI